MVKIDKQSQRYKDLLELRDKADAIVDKAIKDLINLLESRQPITSKWPVSTMGITLIRRRIYNAAHAFPDIAIKSSKKE